MSVNYMIIIQIVGNFTDKYKLNLKNKLSSISICLLLDSYLILCAATLIELLIPWIPAT